MDASRHQTNDVASGRRSRVVLTPLGWRQVGDDALHRADDGDSDVMDTGKSTKETVKPLRGEGRVLLGRTCGDYRSYAFSFLHARLRVRPAPGFPRALCYSRDVHQQNSGVTRRGDFEPRRTPRTPVSRPRRSASPAMRSIVRCDATQSRDPQASGTIDTGSAAHHFDAAPRPAR